MRTINAPRNASDSLWICYFAGPHEGKGPVQIYAGSTHDAENICYRLMKVPHRYTLAVRAPRRSASDRGRRRASRDDYRAKRGTYGGMCLCPCEGSKLAPMATFDPEDPYYSGDRTRKRARSLRYTLRSGKTLLGTVTAVPDARGQFWWQSNVSKDRGITTGLDKAIRLVLKDAGADARRHNVTLYDWTGRSRVVR